MHYRFISCIAKYVSTFAAKWFTTDGEIFQWPEYIFTVVKFEKECSFSFAIITILLKINDVLKRKRYLICTFAYSCTPMIWYFASMARINCRQNITKRYSFLNNVSLILCREWVRTTLKWTWCNGYNMDGISSNFERQQCWTTPFLQRNEIVSNRHD